MRVAPSRPGPLALRGLRRLAVGPLDLTLNPGECCAVTGPSGAGKSILLRMIADLDPHEGGASLGGIDRAAIPATEWRRRVAYVPAESGWWGHGVAEHFAVPPSAAQLAELHLPAEAMGWPVSRLSSGERQRLAFLRAILSGPDVLLLDEPSAALDAAATAAMETVCRRLLADGAILVLVSHDEAQAARLATMRLRLPHPAMPR